MSSLPQPSATSTGRRNRLSIACQTCRYKHFRCDGQKPVCSRCSINGKQCVYPPSRRGNLRNRASPNPVIPRDSLSDLAGTKIRESVLADHDAPAFPPGQTVNLGSSTSDLEGGLRLDLLDLYYEFFHAAHPCVLPRRFIMHRLFEDELQLLVKVIHHVGSLFAPMDRPERGQDLIESALSDFRCGTRVPNSFDVQALLLYSIAVYWRNEPNAGTALLEETIRMATGLGMHRREFAEQNGRGVAVLEESWRRTWWQIFIADAHIAGSAHTFSFRTSGVDMTVDLPCEEHEYEAGVWLALHFTIHVAIDLFDRRFLHLKAYRSMIRESSRQTKRYSSHHMQSL